MKRYKIHITLLFVVLSFTALYVPLCSASEIEYQFSLKQLVDAGSLDVTLLTGNESNPTYTSVASNTSHWSEAIRYYPTDADGKIMSFGLEIYSNNSNLLPDIGDAKNVNFYVPGRFTWATNFIHPPNTGVYPFGPLQAKMRIGFRILLSDGTFKYFFSDWIWNSRYLSNEPSFNLPAYEFDSFSFDFAPPKNSQSIYSTIIEMSIPDDYAYGYGSVGYVMMWGGKASFTLTTGSLADAPIYEGPDTSGYDEYHASEDALLNDTADGRESVGSAIDDGFTALAPGGTLYNSMYFWRELMNDAINQIPMLSPMITVSLAFGLVVFILGGSLIKVLTKESDDKVPRRRGKGD